MRMVRTCPRSRSTTMPTTAIVFVVALTLTLASWPGALAAEPTDGCCAKCIGKPSSKPYSYDPLVFDACTKAKGVCCFNCNGESASQPTVEDAEFPDGVTPQVKAGAWIKLSWSNVARVTYESYQANQVKSSTVRNGSQEAKIENKVFFICAKTPGKITVRGWGEDACTMATTEFSINVAEGSKDGTCAERSPSAPKQDVSAATKTDDKSNEETTCNLQRASLKEDKDHPGKKVCVCADEWTGPPDCTGYPWWKLAATIGGAVAALLSIAVSVKAFMNSRKAKKEAAMEKGDAILGEESITIAGGAATGAPVAEVAPTTNRESDQIYHQPPASLKTRDDKEYTL